MGSTGRKSLWVGILFAAMAAGLVAGCTVPAPVPQKAKIHDADYYRTHPLSETQLNREWGRPLTVMTLDRGVTQWVYPLSPAPVNGYQYFLVRNGQVISSGIWITDISS
ncbi:MAG: hypothetical protein JEZ11_00835 [Desulfobacterales bacterium]|nr:hypothetical protein [Desulfobacterales bacterium]